MSWTAHIFNLTDGNSQSIINIQILVIVVHKIGAASDKSIDLPSYRKYPGSLPGIPSVLLLGGLPLLPVGLSEMSFFFQMNHL